MTTNCQTRKKKRKKKKKNEEREREREILVAPEGGGGGGRGGLFETYIHIVHSVNPDLGVMTKGRYYCIITRTGEILVF